MPISRGFSIIGAIVVLVLWLAAAVFIDLPAPSTSQGLTVLPYTIVYTLLFIPKAVMTGVFSLL